MRRLDFLNNNVAFPDAFVTLVLNHIVNLEPHSGSHTLLISDVDSYLTRNRIAENNLPVSIQVRANPRTLDENVHLILITLKLGLLPTLIMLKRIIVIDNGKLIADGPRDTVVEALQQGRIGKAQ